MNRLDLIKALYSQRKNYPNGIPWKIFSNAEQNQKLDNLNYATEEILPIDTQTRAGNFINKAKIYRGEDE